jgi:hypothetical protein
MRWQWSISIEKPKNPRRRGEWPEHNFTTKAATVLKHPRPTSSMIYAARRSPTLHSPAISPTLSSSCALHRNHGRHQASSSVLDSAGKISNLARFSCSGTGAEREERTRKRLALLWAQWGQAGANAAPRGVRIGEGRRGSSYPSLIAGMRWTPPQGTYSSVRPIYLDAPGFSHVFHGFNILKKSEQFPNWTFFKWTFFKFELKKNIF